MMSQTPGGFEMQNITAMQQIMQRLFLQSAVAQNMQIQQKLLQKLLLLQQSASGVLPFPPLPMEPLFSGDQPYLDQFGRAKTVRTGKWRWPPEKDDGDELAANFFELNLQKQAHKKLASHRSIEEKSSNDFDIHFDSFEFTEEDMKRSNKAGKEEKRQEEKHSTPGLIRKLKLSGELRSKLEMAHSKKNSKQKQVG
ncbi:uncharacterized protein LOC136033588 [Artemia franciscana]|uniref:uncharacterized protein LOC136033588 n=1 Tax=Artemia franciscana TaxID=6661 RepID=UPI0032DB9619